MKCGKQDFALLSLKEMGYPDDFPPVSKAIDWLEAAQFDDGSWLHAPHTTSVALLALSNLASQTRESVEKAASWLTFYGKEEIWSQECYANAYAPLALNSVGISSDSQAIKNGISWLLANQQDCGNGMGFWADEEDTCLAIMALVSTLQLRFKEKKVIIQPVTSKCSISIAPNLLDWQVSTPSQSRLEAKQRVDEVYFGRVTEAIDKLGGLASRSLSKSDPNQLTNHSRRAIGIGKNWSINLESFHSKRVQNCIAE